MKAIILSLPFFFLIFFISCNQKVKNQPVDNYETSTDSLLIFSGVLPCADCPGIETTLKLDFGGFDNMEHYKYELTRVYQGSKSDGKPFVETGNFNMERGFDEDQNATVYVLNWDKNISDRKYYVIYSNDPQTIHQLDMEGHKMESGLNYSLKKK